MVDNRQVRKVATGDLLHITRDASVQFTNAIMFRVIRVRENLITYDGWIWLDGYQLAPDGKAVRRREIFVQYAGLRWLRDQSRSTGGTRPASKHRPVTTSRQTKPVESGVP